tara:strand:+ start:497 stop:1810 length:1314 start_codon:yes stop_codon:yes gene_type:complete
MKLIFFCVILFFFNNNLESKLFDAKQFKLKNGLQVVVIENSRAPVVSQMIWYNVGSIDEEYGKSGLAHFLEHLMFKGTKNYPSGYYSKYISKNGGTENAFTSFDYTAYYQIVPSENLEKIVELEADRMTNLTLTEEQVETEKKVILEERYQRIDSKPSAILDESIRKSLFPNHTYGTPIIGWEHEIKRLSKNDVRKFYNNYYNPKNAILIFSGDVSLEKAKKYSEKYFGKIEVKNNISDDRIQLNDPILRTNIQINYDDENVKQKIWKRSFKTNSYKDSIKNGIALDLGLKILTGGSTSILYRELVEKKKLVSSVGGYYQGMSRDKATVNFYAIPNENVKIPYLEKQIYEIMKKSIADGITEERFNLQKKKYEHESIYLRDSIFQPAQIIGEALSIGIELDEIESWNEILNEISVDDVKNQLKKFIKNKNYVTGLLG